jgi:hypothetical protein
MYLGCHPPLAYCIPLLLLLVTKGMDAPAAART